MQADMEALMATNKRPENCLRPKLLLLSMTLPKPGSSLVGLILVTHAKLVVLGAGRNTEEFPIPRDSSQQQE
ncbi:hypothetical protein ACFX2A_004428 [Malus domestica]